MALLDGMGADGRGVDELGMMEFLEGPALGFFWGIANILQMDNKTPIDEEMK